MPYIKRISLFVFTALSMMLDGCVNYSGIHSSKKIVSAGQLDTKQSLPKQNGHWPTADWAQQFGDPQLVALIHEGIEDNPGLEATRARLTQARAITDGHGSALLPNIGTQNSLIRERFSENIFYPPPFAGSWFTQPQLLVQATYEIDFWGKNLATLRQSISQERASEAALQQAKLTLMSTIASTYIQLAFYYSQQNILVKTAKQRGSLDKLSLIRLNSGLDAQIQMQQTKKLLATSMVQLEQVRGSIRVTKQQLGALLGKGPDRGLTISPPKLRFTQTARLPNDLPLNLLGRRPDIVEARWRVEASLQGVKNAKAKFYPNVNLTALAGVTTFQASNLFTKSSTTYQFTPAVSLPLFDAGSLRADLKRQYGAYDEAVSNYNNTLVNALNDVAAQITNIRSIDQQIMKEKVAFQAANKGYKLAKIQFNTGLNTKIAELQAETEFLQEQQSLLQLMTNRYTSQVALYKALGGGFVELKFDYSMWKNNNIFH